MSRLFNIDKKIEVNRLPRQVVFRSGMVILANAIVLMIFLSLIDFKSYVTIKSELRNADAENYAIVSNKSGLVKMSQFGISNHIGKDACIGVYELNDHTFPVMDQYDALLAIGLPHTLTTPDSTILKLKSIDIQDEAINLQIGNLLNDLLSYRSMYNVNKATYSKLLDNYLENKLKDQEILNLIRSKDSLEAQLKQLLATNEARDASLRNQDVISAQYREERMVNSLKDQVSSLTREINDYSVTRNAYDVNKDFLIKELEFRNNFRGMINDIELALFALKNTVLEWKNRYVITAPEEGMIQLNNYTAYTYLNSGDTIAVISPSVDSTSSFELHFKFPGKYINYLHTGQTVYSELTEYPYLEYGSLSATISEISTIPLGDTYFCKARLNNGFQTTYGKKIKPSGNVMAAQSRVLIKNESLMQKFLKNLRWKASSFTNGQANQSMPK